VKQSQEHLQVLLLQLFPAQLLHISKDLTCCMSNVVCQMRRDHCRAICNKRSIHETYSKEKRERKKTHPLLVTSQNKISLREEERCATKEINH